MNSGNNLRPKKINWFKRLFYSWNRLVNYFENNLRINELQRQKIEEGLISDLKLTLADHLDERIKKLQKNNDDFHELKNKNQELNVENKKLKEIENNSIINEKLINKLNDKVKELTKINNEYHHWKDQINGNVMYNTNVIKQIENIFFRSPRQIGNLGEKAIEQIFEQCGMEKDKFWTTNLKINDTTRVEYAFRLNIDEEQWIPIDVKTFPSFKQDENNKIDYNDLIIAIELEAKKIKKYVNAKNTKPIGMMIIPDDGLCLEISRRYVKKIKEIFDNYGVVVTSTSMFLQWCHILWISFSLSQKFYNDQKFHEDVNHLMFLVKIFINDIVDIRNLFEDLQKKFHYINDVHYLKTKRQYENLCNQLKLSENEKYKIKTDIVKKIKKEE